MQKIKREVRTYNVRIYCDPPCGAELVVKDGRRGIVSHWRHVCKNGHEVDLVDEKYPTIVHEVTP